MYKEIQLKISENVLKEIQAQLITCALVGRPPSASEQATYLILEAIEQDKSNVVIDLKKDLKKKQVKRKRGKR